MKSKLLLIDYFDVEGVSAEDYVAAIMTYAEINNPEFIVATGTGVEQEVIQLLRMYGCFKLVILNPVELQALKSLPSLPVFKYIPPTTPCALPESGVLIEMSPAGTRLGFEDFAAMVMLFHQRQPDVPLLACNSGPVVAVTELLSSKGVPVVVLDINQHKKVRNQSGVSVFSSP